MARFPGALFSILTLSCIGLPDLASGQSCNGWTLRATTGPPAQYGHAMAYDSARGVTVLFGGYNFPSKGDTWEWDGGVWTLRDTMGPPLGHPVMVYDTARRVTVLFNGEETWEWDGATWTQRATTVPSLRWDHAMAYDSARRVTVLFGGKFFGTYNHETWEWDGTNWTKKGNGGPPDRGGHAMAYDSARGVTVLFGGFAYDVYYDDTWEWNGTGWHKRVSSGPRERAYHAMAYDSARGVTVLFGGGKDHPYGASTWEWDGTDWTQRDFHEPPEGRNRHAMVYDSARAFTVLFGGFTDPEKNGDTWEWDGKGDAAWTNYGAGWPGTNGIPTFTAAKDPVLCTAITLDLANSLGASTAAGLLIGLAQTDQPTVYNGHLLVVPLNIRLLSLPGAGLPLAGPLPCDSTFCGRSVYLQALELDPGASQGISFTRGLRLVLGSQ